jgi:hypothetical protein
MGRIVTPIKIANALEPAASIHCDALVDTGTTGMILPAVWRERLGKLTTLRVVEMETADQRIVQGEVCGPVRIQIEGFDEIFDEVVFLDLQPTDGGYEPLVGYVVLEKSRAAVDMVGHRLVPVRHLDLKLWRQLSTLSRSDRPWRDRSIEQNVQHHHWDEPGDEGERRRLLAAGAMGLRDDLPRDDEQHGAAGEGQPPTAAGAILGSVADSAHSSSTFGVAREEPRWYASGYAAIEAHSPSRAQHR